ncbi:MAG TPA: PAS-domain containing protein [Bradyrhizobium sp.]|uniref:PAS-domain containing protein n=1 Tax=Bradyrhizobium sp. TaxID=376 RepID=UPI002D804BE7|nr:PAS-domain containing protein [Bradyrhizobium sp.]HET7887333.1 PAS-domain containing protein [Bradyrhizobium sp.]
MIGKIGNLSGKLLTWIDNFRISEKVAGLVGLLVVVLVLLVVMSIQTVRLQSEYRRQLATSTAAAVNIGRVNALIYAIVMESRGVYMSSDPATAKHYADEILRRNRQLSAVMTEWDKADDFGDEAQFAAFRERVFKFVSFRKELARRATQIGPEAGRSWGDNEANRSLRIALNDDIEALEKELDKHALEVAKLADRTRSASWYLASLGFAGLLLAALNLLIVRRSVTKPLAEIAKTTDLIATGTTNLAIPYDRNVDEIGHLARAVRNFRDATSRNQELIQLELGTAHQRDRAMGERDRLNDKYLETRWQLGAALNNMAQGLIMIDGKGKVLTVNQRYRTMYNIPAEIIVPDMSLRDLLAYRAKHGMFEGNVDEFMKSILDRVAKGKPSTAEVSLPDGRLIRVSEEPMAGGGWVATHEDYTERRRAERMLERTEKFLVSVLETVPQAIVAKDARDLRYVFINRAAEKLMGLPRAEVIGKTVRDLFPADTAIEIEGQDREVLEGNRENEFVLRNIRTPNNGERLVAVRRLRIADQASESMLISMIEDRTGELAVTEAAA